jgi:rhodanese-related sulfurtransferase
MDTQIGTEAPATLVRAGVPMVIPDARAAKWDDGRRVPGARTMAPDAPQESASKVLASKDVLIVRYCRGAKCSLSRELTDRLMQLGYRNVLRYEGGICGWAESGNAVERVQVAA